MAAMEHLDLEQGVELTDFSRNLAAGITGMAGAIDHDELLGGNAGDGIRFHLEGVLGWIEIPEDGAGIAIGQPFGPGPRIDPQGVFWDKCKADFVLGEGMGIADG